MIKKNKKPRIDRDEILLAASEVTVREYFSVQRIVN